MANTIPNVEDYIKYLPEERIDSFKKLYETISENIPSGFKESISNGMVCWSVPLETYPEGYHCTKGMPLPFLSMASQKNFIALYHMGIYAEPQLLQWFQNEYPKHAKYKLDMGKSCIRFKRMEDIPVALIAELCKKMNVDEWIVLYEKNYKK